MIGIVSTIIGILLVLIVCRKGYQKHSLSFGGAMTAFVVGSIHVLSGWRTTVMLIFFYGSSSKLTKMWSNVKKQKEDNFHYGGERKGRQVISNSFIPTILCVLIILLRWNLIEIPNISIEFVENRLFLPTVLSYYTECCADTWGSEVGIISSTPYLLLLPWKPVPAGTNGGISILGMGASLLSSVCMSILYIIIQPSSYSISIVDIVEITVFSAIVGNLIDSFFGSIFEESWWCATKKKVIKRTDDVPLCCKVAEKDNKRVSGFEPAECGLVCGKKIFSGNEINLISSSITSLFVFARLFRKYFM